MTWGAILLEANIPRCDHKGMNTVSNNNQVDSVQMIRLYSICVNKPSNKCTKKCVQLVYIAAFIYVGCS